MQSPKDLLPTPFLLTVSLAGWNSYNPVKGKLSLLRQDRDYSDPFVSTRDCFQEKLTDTKIHRCSVQFSLVTQSCPTLCVPMNCSMPGLPVHHQRPESTQTHVHWVGDVTQPSHPLSSPSPPAFDLSQHQGLFQWVNFSHEVAKVLGLQLQHQSFQWTPRTDLL